MLHCKTKPILERRATLARVASIALAATVALAPDADAAQPPIRDDARPTAGAAVATDHPLATEAAWEVLRQGGTAVDAATAAAFVLTVMMPEAASLAGAGTALHYDGEGRHITAYIGREISGAAARPEWKDRKLRDGTVKLKGGRTVGAPTFMHMLGALRDAGGRLPWAELTRDAERIARDGIRLSERSAKALAAVTMPMHGGADQIFGEGGLTALRTGAHIRNPGLVEVLQAIGVDGPDVLAGGVIGAAISETVGDATRMPAELTLEEISKAKATIAPPHCIAYRQAALCAPPQPTLGATTLQAIGILDRALPRPLTPLAWAHTLAQSHRLAMSDARRYLGDPAFFPDLMSPLLKSRQLNRRARRIDPLRDRGTPGSSRVRGAPRGLDGSKPHKHSLPTAGVVVVSGEGDAVALSMTLTLPFGSGLAVRGILMNAANASFDPRSRRERFHVANEIAGGKRPRLDLAPIMALDADRRLILAATSAGGPNAPAYLAKAVTLALGLDKSAAAAVAAPNIASPAKRTEVEAKTAAERLQDGLADFGHQTKSRRLPSGLLLIKRVGRGLEAAADPRGYGSAMSEPPPPPPAPAAPDAAAADALDSTKRGS